MYGLRHIVLVGIVAWMQKGNTTVGRNILLVRDRSTFHEKNLVSAEPWCHSSLFPLYGEVDPSSVENVYQLKKVLVGPEAGENKFVLHYL